MSWLARMEINAETIRAAGIFDNYAWHKRLWECFPDAPESRRDFLTRIDQLEGAFRVWLLAQRQPSCPSWCSSEDFSSKAIAPSFFSHRYYAFDLRANPVKAVVQRDSSGEVLCRANGKRKSGKRVPLVKPEELRDWIIRKGNVRCRDMAMGMDILGGFRVVENKPLEISPMVAGYFRKKGQGGYHGGVQFRGILEVTDREKFIETYHAGIGSAKGFGFGLLLLAPLNL